MELYKDLVQLSTPIIGAIALFIFQKMSDSVAKLNENVAVVIEKIERHEEDIAEAKIISIKHGNEISELKLELAKKGVL